MKTRAIILAALILISGNYLYARKLVVNADVSSVKWVGKKIGSQHEGYIKLKSGHLELKENRIVDGSIVMDMSSITNTDVKNEEYNQKLVSHLESDDFFGVEKYPTATFVVTESTTFSNDKATLTGELSIKGKTETISFEVQKSGEFYMAQIEVDRSKFDVRYGSDSFFDNLGDKAIDDIFTLEIKLVI